MKTSLTMLLLILLLFPLSYLSAQIWQNGNSGLPFKPERSVLFGKDIVIYDSASENQTKVVISSAYNGWLYAAYEYFSTQYDREAFEVLKSVDNGITWDVIFGGPIGNSVPFASFDIAVIGDSVSNIKVIFGCVIPSGAAGNDGDGEVWRFDGNGNYLDGISLGATYIALATDFMYPASNSDPCSIGVLYASNYATNYNNDTLYLLSSSNGGMSYNNRQVIAFSSNHFHDVALAYGRSPSWSSGRYFAAWSETNDFTTYTGHIYTAHSNPDFNSPFTTPVELDNLDPSAYGNARNPAIACQYNNVDNDSSNLTEVVLFDKYIPTIQTYDITGYYNLQAANHSHFQKLIISNSAHNNFQSSINFNPFDSTFMVTYYDSTTQKLPFLLNNFNLAHPDSWQWVTTGYNDDSNLASPYPKVVLDLGQEQGAVVWVKEGTGGNGVAMFDAPYSTYTGISVNNIAGNGLNCRAYPNPCNQSVILAFELKRTEKVTIQLYNLVGQPIGVFSDQSYPAGKHEVNIDVSKLSSGSYIYTLKAGDFSDSGKINIIR
jgi:hypothetical protein